MPVEQTDVSCVAAGAADASTALTDMQVTAHRIAEYLEFGGDPVRAGKDIQSFADQHGDAAVLALIDGLTDIDLSSVLRQYDLTATSPIQQVISPDRFAALVEMEYKYASSDYAELRGMLSGVLFVESNAGADDRAIECLEALVWQPHALELLAGMLLKHAETEILNFWLYGSFLVAAPDPDRDVWLIDCLNGHAPLDIDVVRSLAASSTGDCPEAEPDDMPYDWARGEADTRFGMADGDLQQICWMLREYHDDFFMDMMLQILRTLITRNRDQKGRT